MTNVHAPFADKYVWHPMQKMALTGEEQRTYGDRRIQRATGMGSLHAAAQLADFIIADRGLARRCRRIEQVIVEILMSLGKRLAAPLHGAGGDVEQLSQVP